MKLAINAIRSEYASVVWLKKYSGMKYMLIPDVEGFYSTLSLGSVQLLILILLL